MMAGLLERAAGADPSKVAVIYGGETIRYDELADRAARCAAGLSQRGVREGDCVATVLPNCPDFIVTFFATMRLGAIFLPLNPQYKQEEFGRFLAECRPRAIVSSGAAAALLRGVAEVPVVSAASLAAESGGGLPRGNVETGPALYLYTSGSTDTCKRVCCTQENLYWEARNFVETAGLTASDTILCSIPLFHSYGIGNCLLDAAYTGATLALLGPSEDDPPFANRCREVAELIRAANVRFYPGVPHQFSVLASLAPGFPIDLSGVRLFVSSGDALTAHTFDRFRARYGRAIRSLYGSTEAGSIAMNTDRDELVGWDSVGPPLRNVAVDIRDGEIWVKSRTIPSSVADGDGFYRTGDLGHTDERGHLALAGRRQSFLNVAGYKVDVAEIESVLESCPGVREAAVVGVAVPRMGTLVKAAVVTEGACREAEIRAHCRQKLAFYKVPRLIERYDALPRSAVGKVLKSELGKVESYLEQIRNAESARALQLMAVAPAAKRRALAASVVRVQAAAVLGLAADAVPREVGFVELGMDSFGAMELHARLEYLFDLELPQTLSFDHPTVDAVTEFLMERGQRHEQRGAGAI